MSRLLGRPSASLRIGLVCPYSLTIPGGVQGQVLALSRTLRRRGQQVRVLAPCDGPPPDAAVTPLGNSVPTAANGSIAPIAPDISATLRTIRALNDEEFDILHLHEPLVPGPTMTALFGKNAPIVGTFHAAGGSAAYDLLGPIVRWLGGRIDVRVAVSDDARQMAKRSLGGDYEVLFNGVEVDRFANADPWPKDGPTVLFIGRHEERKGLGVLLESFANLGPEVRLWVAGEGPQTADLQRRHAGDPRIEWLGTISDVERDSRLRGADVFCAPSLMGESFGVVLLESMAAGTPVVASEIPGYARVARNHLDALLVAAGDARAMGAALNRVFADKDLAGSLVESGRRRAEEFSMERLADEYLIRYHSL